MDFETATRELATFFRTGPKRSFGRKEVISSQFVNVDKVYWLERGHVKTVSYSARGDAHIHHIYGAQEVFPLSRLPFSQKGPASFVKNLSCIAIGEVTVYEKNCADVETFIRQNPEALVQLVSQQYFIFDRLYNLSMDSARQRVVYRLLSLADRFGVKHDGHIIIDLPITIQEIADTINVSRETTGRILSDLENHNNIMLSRKSILIYPDKLQEQLGTTD